MLIEDLTPDFGPEYYEDLATEEQKYQVNRLKLYGWVVTHLWEREKDQVCVWLCVRSRETQVKISPLRHCFIKPDGEMIRYEPRDRVSIG